MEAVAIAAGLDGAICVPMAIPMVAPGANASAPLRAITSSTGETLKDVAFGDFEQFEFKGWNDRHNTPTIHRRRPR